jgi:hypothetical protein
VWSASLCVRLRKDAAQRAKVDGLVLCFLCTRKYKRRRHDEERKGIAATPAEWSAKCDALQRELTACEESARRRAEADGGGH